MDTNLSLENSVHCYCSLFRKLWRRSAFESSLSNNPSYRPRSSSICYKNKKETDRYVIRVFGSSETIDTLIAWGVLWKQVGYAGK